MKRAFALRPRASSGAPRCCRRPASSTPCSLRVQAHHFARSFADRSITGGFFDGKTSAEERRAYLLGLLRADGAAGGANAGATDCGPGLNALLARSEVELAQFAALDRHLDAQERSAGLEECAPANTHSHVVSGCISASWSRIGFVVLFCLILLQRALQHEQDPHATLAMHVFKMQLHDGAHPFGVSVCACKSYLSGT